MADAAPTQNALDGKIVTLPLPVAILEQAVKLILSPDINKLYNFTLTYAASDYKTGKHIVNASLLMKRKEEAVDPAQGELFTKEEENDVKKPE